jgi:hypothetical protein
VIQTASSTQGYFICQPMLTYGRIMPIWTSQYPIAPLTVGSPVLHFQHIVAGHTDPTPGEPYN